MSRKIVAFSAFLTVAVALTTRSESQACPPGMAYPIAIGPPVIFIPVYPAMPGSSPTIEVAPKPDGKSRSKSGARTTPLPPPKVTIEPAGFATPEAAAIPDPTKVPVAKPEPAKHELSRPEVPPTPAKFELLKPEATQPKPELPKPEVPAKMVELPIPKLELPKPDAPKLPTTANSAPEIPPIPLPTPRPVDPEPAKIPSFTPKQTDGNSNLPALNLPTLPNLDPTRTSQSSPLTGGSRVDVFPAEGKRAANGKHRVVFFNQSDREVMLTVEGESVRLPAKHKITAEVAGRFSWKLDRGDPRATVLPDDSCGADIVIRP